MAGANGSCWPVARLQEQFQAQELPLAEGHPGPVERAGLPQKVFRCPVRDGPAAPRQRPGRGHLRRWRPAERAGAEDPGRDRPLARCEAFCLARPIVGFYEAFLGGPVYLHKRKLLRQTIPGDPNSTGIITTVTITGWTDRGAPAGSPSATCRWRWGPDLPGGLAALGRKTDRRVRCPKRSPAGGGEDRRAYNRNMTETGWLTKDLPSWPTALMRAG